MSNQRGKNAKPGYKGFQEMTPEKVKAPEPKLVESKNTGKGLGNETKLDTSRLDAMTDKYAKLNRKAKIVKPAKTKQDYLAAFEKYQVSPVIARRAATILATNPPILIAASGKMASGKDTIILEVLKNLNNSSPYKRLSYAAPLKNETQEVLDLLRNNSRRAAMAELITRGASKEEANKVLEIAYDAAQNEPELTSHDRTPWIRLMLQYWGVEVRKSKDENYWINKAIQRAAEYIVKGDSILVTDARFPGEVEALQDIGFTVFRLDVDAKTQASRLMSRDGLMPDSTALSHSTEVALDSFDGFDIVVDNSEGAKIEKVVENIVKYYKKKVKSNLIQGA